MQELIFGDETDHVRVVIRDPNVSHVKIQKQILNLDEVDVLVRANNKFVHFQGGVGEVDGLSLDSLIELQLIPQGCREFQLGRAAVLHLLLPIVAEGFLLVILVADAEGVPVLFGFQLVQLALQLPADVFHGLQYRIFALRGLGDHRRPIIIIGQLGLQISETVLDFYLPHQFRFGKNSYHRLGRGVALPRVVYDLDQPQNVVPFLNFEIKV